jgi:hypothetical protein
LRQAYDYWQDQPDYYPQALLGRVRLSETR